jgi:hypothetical protein
MRARHAWVQKLPALLTGIPDWLMVKPGLGICLVEAKKLQEAGSAFVPSQCKRAQRFWLEVVARHGGQSYILVLGRDCWYMSRVEGKVRAISIEEFGEMAELYPGGWSGA